MAKKCLLEILTFDENCVKDFSLYFFPFPGGLCTPKIG